LRELSKGFECSIGCYGIVPTIRRIRRRLGLGVGIKLGYLASTTATERK